MMYKVFGSISISKAIIAYDVDKSILNGGISMSAFIHPTLKERITRSISMSIAGFDDERGNETTRANVEYVTIWKK